MEMKWFTSMILKVLSQERKDLATLQFYKDF